MAAAAMLKYEKSPYFSNGSTDRHEIWHRDAHWPSWPSRPLKIWIFENWKSNIGTCRNVYSGCVKFLLRNLSVTEFGQFDSEILYNDTRPKYRIAHITHKIAHVTHFKITLILTGEDGPLKLNLLIKQQILIRKTEQFTTMCKGDRVVAPKQQISLW